MDRRGRLAMKYAARPPKKFANGLAKALDSKTPFTRRAVGPDARMLVVLNRMLPSVALHNGTRLIMGLPRSGGLTHQESDNG
jgi:hypothetical protein